MEAGRYDVLDRGRNRGHARTKSTGPYAPFQGRDALFQNIRGRIHEPGINIAEFFQRKQIGGVLRIIKDIACRLIDRYRTAVGRTVNFLACMECKRVQFVLFFFHLHFLIQIRSFSMVVYVGNTSSIRSSDRFAFERVGSGTVIWYCMSSKAHATFSSDIFFMFGQIAFSVTG